MKIAKLILHYNTPKETAALVKMVPGAIVVNNGSKDHFPGEIFYKDNLGFVRNWNRVIGQLMKSPEHYEAFWLMNSDIVIKRRSVRRILELMSSGRYSMLTPNYNCWMKQCQCQDTGGVREVRCMEFTAPLIHRRVFEKLGLFDERFNMGSGVDFDFALRAQAAGIQLYCDDGSTFVHLEHKSISNQENVHDYSARARQEMTVGMRRRHGINWKSIIKTKLDINKKGTLMKKVAVYTTIFGGYDDLVAVPRQNIPADYFCITDKPKEFKQADGMEQWNIVQVSQPRKDLHPRMRAKWYKVFPWELEELRQYEVTIFIDGCVQITSPDFVQFMLKSLRTDIAVFKHPERNCIFEEVKASEIMMKYQDESIHEQTEYYRKIFPANAGLYACTVIVRKNTERTRALMMSWMHENIKFSWQDQLSFPVVCRVHKVIPDVIPGNLYQNPYFKRIHHADKEDQKLIGKEPKAGEPNTRNEVIQYIIDKLGYKTYLEIGLRNGDTFNEIQCGVKDSIDPVTTGKNEPTFLMTSDQFFEEHKKARYDMVFIDGDHNHRQVTRDLLNAFKIIPKNGCIVLHDTNPVNERYTADDRCGTAFRVLVDIMCMNEMPFELYTLTIPSDEGNGISIVFNGKRTTENPVKDYSIGLPHPYDEYKLFDKHRKEIANLVTWKELKKIIDTKAKTNDNNRKGDKKAGREASGKAKASEQK